MTTNNRVERIKQEFKERFLPTQFKANGGDDQKLADIMYRAMVSSYDEWFTKTLTQLEKEVQESRDAEWVEVLKSAHPSVLAQLKGEISLKRLLENPSSSNQ